MLFSILSSGGTLGEKLVLLLISVLALLPALSVHEWAHGYAAYKLGDSTARADGRLSLNPLDHLDPLGTLMLLLVGFGWAKPVPIVTRNFKNPRKGMALSAIAGPISNLLLGLVFVILDCLAVFVFNFAFADGFPSERAFKINVPSLNSVSIHSLPPT